MPAPKPVRSVNDSPPQLLKNQNLNLNDVDIAREFPPNQNPTRNPIVNLDDDGAEDADQGYETLSSSDEDLTAKREELEIVPVSPQLLKQPRDATRLNTREAAKELQLRGLRATGFWGEDCQTLQACFDDEHRELVAQHHEQQRLLKEHQERERIRAYKLRLKARQRADENAELNRNRHFKYWLELATTSSCPPHAAFETLNRCSTRLLSKVLPNVCRLRSLDLSNSSLDDKAGVRLVNALKLNRSIQRLELENTKIGVMTAQTFGFCLGENTTLSAVCLDRNDLTKRETNWSGVTAIVNGLQTNTNLSFFNLNSCCLGEEGGKMLVSALQRNSNLLFLGYAGNRVSITEEQTISDYLERNKVYHAARVKERKKEVFEAKLQDDVDQARTDREQKQQEEEDWLERRKVERATERRRQDDLSSMRREDEALQNLYRLERLEELERLKHAKRKKKGKKGKGKGKGKGKR